MGVQLQEGRTEAVLPLSKERSNKGRERKREREREKIIWINFQLNERGAPILRLLHLDV
jgi:hypothetical protein